MHQASASEENSQQSKDTKLIMGNKQLWRIYKLKQYDACKSEVEAIIMFIPHLVFIFIQINTYYCSNSTNGLTCMLQTNQLLAPPTVESFRTLNILIQLYTIIAIYFHNFQLDGMGAILTWTASTIYPYLRILIEFQLTLSAIFLTISSSGNELSIFMMAMSINIFATFFLQNYTARKDLLCCKSLPFSMILKAVMIVGYLIIYLVNNLSINIESSLILFITVNLILSLTAFISYFAFGYTIYRYKQPKWMVIVFICGYFGTFLPMLAHMLQNIVCHSKTTTNFSEIAVSFIILLYISHILLLKKYRTVILPNYKNLFKKQYILLQILEHSNEAQNNGIIQGLLQVHQITCQKSKCYSKLTEVYDGKKKKVVLCSDLHKDKTSLLKFYIKCNYETIIQEDERNMEVLLDFAEFMYLKLKNVSEAMKILQKIQISNKSPLQSLRIYRLIGLMKQENNLICRNIFNKKMNIEHLITAEEDYQEIKSVILNVLKMKIEFWDYMAERQVIDLAEIKSMLVPTFELESQLKNQWKKISKYFQIQRRWKFEYVCYWLFIRNKRTKLSFIEQFGSQANLSLIFQECSIQLQKQDSFEELCNQNMLFEQNSCYVHAQLENNSFIITKVSDYFSKIFGYEKHEVKGSNLEILLPDLIATHHTQIALQWVAEGRPSNQTNFSPAKVFTKTKSGQLVEVFKFVKQYISQERGLEYISLLKRNTQQEKMMLVDENFEIDSISQSLMQTFRLSPRSYADIKSFNLLCLAPSLLRKTKFRQLCKNFNSFQENMNSRNADNFSRNLDENQIEEDIVLRKISRVTLTLPNFLYKIAHEYIKMKQTSKDSSDEALFEIITKLKDIISQEENQKIYECTISLKKIICQNKIIYLVLFDKIQFLSKSNLKQAFEGDSSKSNKIFNHFDQEDDTFQNQFSLKKAKNSINITTNQNIFIKEVEHMPQENNSKITCISWIFRMFLILSILSGGMYLLLLRKSYASLKTFTRGYQNTLAFYQLPFSLRQNYYGKMLGIDEYGNADKLITNNSRRMVDLSEENIFYRVIYNTALNVPKEYQPANHSGFSLDQVKLIYTILTSTRVLAFQNNRTHIDPTSSDYSLFDNFLFPAFYQLMNNTKINTNKAFNANLAKVQSVTTFAMVTSASIGIIMLIFTIIYYRRYTRSMKALTDIQTQFSNNQIETVRSYHSYVLDVFRKIHSKNQHLKIIDQNIRKDEMKENEQSFNGYKKFNRNQQNQQKMMSESIFLNKKARVVNEGKNATKQHILKYISILVPFILLMAVNFAVLIYSSLQLTQVEGLEADGYKIFRFHPTIRMPGVILAETYYNNLHNIPNNPHKYDEIINNLFLISKRAYVGVTRTQTAPDFYDKQKRYYYGNLCSENSDLLQPLNYTVKQCETKMKSSFTSGIIGYVGTCSQIIESKIHGNSTILESDIFQLLTAGYIASVYLEDMIQTWFSDIIIVISDIEDNLIIIAVICFCIEILFFALFIEGYLIKSLKADYHYYQKLYWALMPEFVVSNQKIVKSKLIVEGILQK